MNYQCLETIMIQKIGTGVRDYIHVVDLAKGHIKALEKLEKENTGIYIYNLGTGTGYSVLDMVKAFEKTTGKKVPYKIVQRRPGDIATCYSDPSKAKNELRMECRNGNRRNVQRFLEFYRNEKKLGIIFLIFYMYTYFT